MSYLQVFPPAPTTPAWRWRRPLTVVRALRSFFLGPHSIKDPATASLYSGGGATASGVSVTHENAATYSAVFDAVQQISGDIAALPLVLHKRLRNGGKEPYVESKLYRMMHDEPNPEMGSMVLRRTIQAHALTWGNGYAEIERDGAGRPAELWVLTPDRVEPFRPKLPSGRLGKLTYRIDNKTELDAMDVLHIQGIGFDGTVGYDVVNLARLTIGLALASERFAAAFFGNGSTFGGIFSTKEGETLEDDELAAIRKELEGFHQGPDRAHRFLILQKLAYQRLGIAPGEGKMTETREAAIADVARFFSMPLHKLKSLDRATDNNIERLDLDYYKSTLLRWIKIWEEECNRKLIPRLEYRHQFFKHNVRAFLRGDWRSQNEALALARDRGVISANEWRDLDDWNPQPGDQGDQYLIQGAMVPADRLDDIIDANVKAKTAKATPPAPADPDHVAALEEARTRAAAADALAAERQHQVDAEKAAREAASAEAMRLQHEATLAATALTAAQTERDNVQATLTATLTARDEEQRQTEAGHAATMSAHRALAAHTMRLMVERETTRARRTAASPEKLRASMLSFYDGHQALMVQALQPVVAVHLAWIRSTESAADRARTLAEAHIAESRRQLEAVADGDAGALAASLAQLLDRWERDRPQAFADDLFEQEMAYVRGQRTA